MDRTNKATKGKKGAGPASDSHGTMAKIFCSRRVLIGPMVVVFIAAVALFARQIAPYSPTKMNPSKRFASPSAHHILGTDFYGRDILSRITYGYRSSLSVAFLSVSIALLLGGALGITAAYVGKTLDMLIMRTMDILFAFPVLLLAIVIVVILGPGMTSTVLAIGIVYVPIFARTARGPTLAVKEESFIEASRALGVSSLRIILRHILPNVSVPIFVQITISLATAILFESALSFLGLGVQPPHPSLGSMVSEGRIYIELTPWPVLFPGIAIAIIVLGFNLTGDAVRQILNPKLRVK